MKCPLCTDGTISADDLSKVPVKVITRMYPAPHSVIVDETVDLSGVVSNLELSSDPGDRSRLNPARMRFDVTLATSTISVTKTNGSTIYELTTDLSGLKEI